MDEALIVKMRTLAKNHPRKEELTSSADQLESALAEFKIPNVVGAWAKARKLYCEITGEPLI